MSVLSVVSDLLNFLLLKERYIGIHSGDVNMYLKQKTKSFCKRSWYYANTQR